MPVQLISLQDGMSNFIEHVQKYDVIILRGTPGAGKTTLANKLCNSGVHRTSLSFDTYKDVQFRRAIDIASTSNKPIADGYRIQLYARINMLRRYNDLLAFKTKVVVDANNTFIWEMSPYIYNAELTNASVIAVHMLTFNVVEAKSRSSSNVSEEEIRNMMMSYEYLPEQLCVDELSLKMPMDEK